MSEQEIESKSLQEPKAEPAAAVKAPVSEKPVESAPPAPPQEPAASQESVAPEKVVTMQKPAAPEKPAAPSEPVSIEPPVTRADFDQLKAERDQLADRLARLQAEFENARKRADRERVSDRDFATGSVVKQFLPVLDNFELALKSSGSAPQLRSGVELIRKQMEDILRQLHVHAIPAVGAEFDPRLHEALGSVERDDLPDQHVAEEIRRGYKLRDRLLRPALVRVASNPKQKSE
jgi:molecular chaperone GrpE